MRLLTVALLVVSGYLFTGSTYSQTISDDSFIPNMNNVDIHTLIQTVSKRTGKNFIVDPRVSAKVTVVTSNPVDADELYSLFLSVLDVHGFAAVDVGHFIKIVPAQVGVQSAIPVQSDQLKTDDKLITKVIPVKHVPAGQLIEALRPLLSATASISAEANSNTLIVTDRAANVARLEEIISSLDRVN